MFESLAKGDSQTVENQLRKFREKTKGLDIAVYDFAGRIAFATKTGMVGKRVADIIANRTARNGIEAQLKSGNATDDPVEDNLDGLPAITMFRPILNGADCMHCHGSARKILGGVLVRESIAEAADAEASARNKSIFLGILGAFILVLSMYFLVRMIVDLPIRKLLAAGEQMRKGDLTVQIDVKGRDEIAHHVCENEPGK